MAEQVLQNVVAGEDYNPYTFVWVLTGVFGAIFAIGPLLVPRGPDQDVIRISIMLAAFHMWIVWVTIYCSQVHPIDGLSFKNTTLLWISRSWGNGRNVKPISMPTTSTEPPPTTTTSTTTTTRLTTAQITRPTTTTTTVITIPYTGPPTSPPPTTSTTPTTPEPTPPPATTKAPSTFANGSLVPTRAPSTVAFRYATYSASNPQQYFPVYRKKDDRGLIIFSVMTNKPAEVTISDKADHINSERIIITYGINDRDYRIERLAPMDTKRTENGVARNYIRMDRYGVLSNTSYKRFYIRWRQGTYWIGDDYFFLTPISTWTDPKKPSFDVNFVSFFTEDPNAQWYIERGCVTEIPTISLSHTGRTNPRRYLKHELRSDWTWTNRTGYHIAKSSYKFFYIQSEPIWFSVNIDNAEYREFFVLLSTTYLKIKPYILIHIGGEYGKACTISKNTEIIVRVFCDIEWRKKSYINFWIFYKRGNINVLTGYDTNNKKEVMSWTDPETVFYKFYGLRTSIGEFVHMHVESLRED